MPSDNGAKRGIDIKYSEIFKIINKVEISNSERLAHKRVFFCFAL